MYLIEKIRKKGFIGTIKKIIEISSKCINVIFYYIFFITPIDTKLIVFESEGDLSDNAFALYDYMKKKGLLKKYKAVWMVDSIKEAEIYKFENTIFINKTPCFIDICRMYYLAKCQWYIYDHCNLLSNLYTKKEKKIIYLSHGWGYKAAKEIDNKKKTATSPNYICATGVLSAQGLAAYWQEPMEKMLITGYPRIDYFYFRNQQVEKKIEELYDLNTYKKILFWMPTFRKSNISHLSEDYNHYQTGLPIFETEEDLEKFDTFLYENNFLMIFKLHHLQAELPIFNKKYKNIIILRDRELYQQKVQLYQVIKYADVVISDYSSITIDVLPLDIPLIYTLDDYEEYKKNRGIYPENAIEYMPGYHVYNINDLQSSLIEISNGIDKFKADRSKLLKLYHEYNDGNSSKRILNFLSIE